MSGFMKTMLKETSLWCNCRQYKSECQPFFSSVLLSSFFYFSLFGHFRTIFGLSGLTSKCVAYLVQKNTLFLNHVSINPVINMKIHSSFSNSLKLLQTITIMLISSIFTDFLYTTQNSCYFKPRWIFKN